MLARSWSGATLSLLFLLQSPSLLLAVVVDVGIVLRKRAILPKLCFSIRYSF